MHFGQTWNLFCDVNLFQYNSCLDRFCFDGQLIYKTLITGVGLLENIFLLFFLLKYYLSTSLITHV